ncbi:50S ribosomal protein L28 [Akkermansiaceae bacterium]|nr:50S ribosomal protein L28 [Akkermansiaceae bacterium]
MPKLTIAWAHPPVRSAKWGKVLMNPKNPLDPKLDFPISPATQQFCFMARVCSIRGSKVRVGRKIHRSGLAKKKGGIGRHVTKTVKRKVSPNLQSKRVWIPELSKFVKIKVSAKGIKTINKNGAYATLKKAGLI